MSDKKFMAVIAGLAVVIIGAVILFGGKSSNAFIGDPLKVADGTTADADGNVQPADHISGAGNKGVTIIEFADFECPACYTMYGIIEQVRQDYGDDITFVFRNNPLSQLHPNAFAAHRAAEAAGLQGKFWEMYNLLYQGQPTWSYQSAGLTTSQAAGVFEGYAEQLSLDMEKYRADVDSKEVYDIIDSHLDAGAQLGVTGTPTIFINGEEVQLRQYSEFKQYIDNIIAGNQASQESPTETTN